MHDNKTYNLKIGEQYISEFNLLRKADLNIIILILSNYEKLNIKQLESEKDDKIDTSNDNDNEISSNSDYHVESNEKDNIKFIKRSKIF